MPPTQNTTLRIPPAAELGEIAYRQFTLQVTPSGMSVNAWSTWQQLSDTDRQPWMMVGLVVAEAVRKANEHADG